MRQQRYNRNRRQVNYPAQALPRLSVAGAVEFDLTAGLGVISVAPSLLCSPGRMLDGIDSGGSVVATFELLSSLTPTATLQFAIISGAAATMERLILPEWMVEPRGESGEWLAPGFPTVALIP